MYIILNIIIFNIMLNIDQITNIMEVITGNKTSHHGPSIEKKLMLWAIDVPHMPKQREAKM